MSDIQAVTYQDAVTVTESDSVDDTSGPFAGLWCTSAGTLSFVTPAGSVVTLNVATNGLIPIACKRVNSTGTAGTFLGLLAAPFKKPFNPGSGVVLP